MRIKEGFELRNVCGEHVVVATGMQNIDFSKIINFNESAAVLWNGLQDKDFTIDDIVEVLLSEYEVDEATARQDAEAIAKSWMEIGIIE